MRRQGKNKEKIEDETRKKIHKRMKKADKKMRKIIFKQKKLGKKAGFEDLSDLIAAGILLIVVIIIISTILPAYDSNQEKSNNKLKEAINEINSQIRLNQFLKTIYDKECYTTKEVFPAGTTIMELLQKPDDETLDCVKEAAKKYFSNSYSGVNNPGENSEDWALIIENLKTKELTRITVNGIRRLTTSQTLIATTKAETFLPSRKGTIKIYLQGLKPIIDTNIAFIPK